MTFAHNSPVMVRVMHNGINGTIVSFMKDDGDSPAVLAKYGILIKATINSTMVYVHIIAAIVPPFAKMR